MKKRLAILLALAMIFSLAACGKKSADEKADKASEKVESKADTEKKEDKKEEAKAKGMIDVHGDDIFTTPEGVEELSDERLTEIAEYFDEDHLIKLEGMTYEEVEEYIGMPGAHFVDFDDEDENGIFTKSIFWYSPDQVFFTIFTADKDSPDDFGLTMAGAMPKNFDEDEEYEEDDEEYASESYEEMLVEFSRDTGMVEVTNGNPFISPGDTWEISEEDLKEIADYFDENYEETLGMTYEELKDYIGLPGAHYEALDDVDSESGDLIKQVFWYSPDHVFVVVFTADKDSPDDFGLDFTAYYDQD